MSNVIQFPNSKKPTAPTASTNEAADNKIASMTTRIAIALKGTNTEHTSLKK